MPEATAADRARQLLVLVLAAGQVAASFVPALTGYGRPLGEGDPALRDNPAAPPGAAFVIWGLLFTAVLAYAVYQGSPQRATDPLLRRVGWVAAAALALTVLWVTLAQLAGLSPLADTLFSASILGCYLLALTRAAGTSQAAPRLVTAPLALMAGWLTVAFGVNLSAALIAAGGVASPSVVAGCVVAAAGVAGILVPRFVGGGGWYAGPVVWGLGWVAAGNAGPDGDRLVAVAAGVAAALVGAVAVLFPPRLYRDAS